MMMMHSSSARSRRSTSLRRNNSNSRRQVRRSFSNKCKTSMAPLPSPSLLLENHNCNETRTGVNKKGDNNNDRFNSAPRNSLSALDLRDNNDRKEDEEQHGDDDSLAGLLDNNNNTATPLRHCRHPFSNKTKLKPHGSALSSSSVLVVIRRAAVSSKKKLPPPCSSIYELLVQEDDNNANANDIDDCQKEFIVKKNSETNVNHKKKKTNDDQAMMMEFDVFVEDQQDGSMRLTACEVDQYITTLMTRTTQARDCIITFGLDFNNDNASDCRTSMIRTRNPDVARRLVKQQQAASLSLSLSRVLEDEPHQQLLNNNKPHHQPHHHHDEEEVSSLSISTDSNLQRQEQEQLLQQVHATSDGSSTTKASVASVSSSNHHHQNNHKNQTAIRTKAPAAPQRQRQPQRSSNQQQTREEFRIPVAHSKFPPVKAFQMFILRDCPHINQTFHMESYYDTAATNKGPRRRPTMRRRRDCFDPVRYHLIVDHGNGSLRFHLSAKQVLDHVQEQLTHHQCLFWLCLLLGSKDNNPQEDDNNKQPPVYTKTCDPYVARALVRQDSLSYQPHQQQPESTTPVMMEKVLQWMQRAWYKRNKNKNMKKHHQW